MAKDEYKALINKLLSLPSETAVTIEDFNLHTIYLRQDDITVMFLAPKQKRKRSEATTAGLGV